MEIMSELVRLLQGGLGNLAAYLAAHVLLCLLPAFYIAGAMTALIPKSTVTRFLGHSTPKVISYPAAALAGSVLAVCSCTIVPIFAGIYKKGAGIGPAITFLFFAPAANILALIYTGGMIGTDLAFARLFLSLAFGIGIGLIMALIFRRDDEAHDRSTDVMFAAQNAQGMRKTSLAFLLILVVLLLTGTLKVSLLTDSFAQTTLPIPGVEKFQETLDRIVPYDDSKGEEGVSVQGVVLIILLAMIGLASWKGFENIHDGFNRWTWIALGLTGLTLEVAALRMKASSDGLILSMPGKFIGVFLALSALFWLGRFRLSEDDLRDFLWESWHFVRQIFPLLIVGVTAVGVIRVIIRPEWIESLAGSNSILGNMAGVTFGVFMYFPTLVEVPIANMFLDLGMHRGPLLAYLMADPELSLQSILIISTIIGRRKAWIYVGWVALFSTLAGLIYGSYEDGASLWSVTLYVVAFLAMLALILYLVNRRSQQKAATPKMATAD
jgi:uncharacterized membrane protein YraQ (UPF0718 family)